MVPSHDAIERRAYEIWQAEGRPEGQADRHWLKAESEFYEDHPPAAVFESGLDDAQVDTDRDTLDRLYNAVRTAAGLDTPCEEQTPAVEPEPNSERNSRDRGQPSRPKEIPWTSAERDVLARFLQDHVDGTPWPCDDIRSALPHQDPPRSDAQIRSALKRLKKATIAAAPGSEKSDDDAHTPAKDLVPTTAEKPRPLKGVRFSQDEKAIVTRYLDRDRVPFDELMPLLPGRERRQVADLITVLRRKSGRTAAKRAAHTVSFTSPGGDTLPPTTSQVPDAPDHSDRLSVITARRWLAPRGVPVPFHEGPIVTSLNDIDEITARDRANRQKMVARTLELAELRRRSGSN